MAASSKSPQRNASFPFSFSLVAICTHCASAFGLDESFAGGIFLPLTSCLSEPPTTLPLPPSAVPGSLPAAPPTVGGCKSSASISSSALFTSYLSHARKSPPGIDLPDFAPPLLPEPRADVSCCVWLAAGFVGLVAMPPWPRTGGKSPPSAAEVVASWISLALRAEPCAESISVAHESNPCMSVSRESFGNERMVWTGNVSLSISESGLSSRSFASAQASNSK